MNLVCSDCPYLRKEDAIYQFKEFMLSTHVCKTYSLRICSRRLCMASTYVRDFYVCPSCAKIPGTIRTLCNDEMFPPDSFLRCIQTVISERSTAYAKRVFTHYSRQRITSFPFKRELPSGEMHVIVHATNDT
jgi:hypothetical protein